MTTDEPWRLFLHPNLPVPLLPVFAEWMRHSSAHQTLFISRPNFTFKRFGCSRAYLNPFSTHSSAFTYCVTVLLLKHTQLQIYNFPGQIFFKFHAQAHTVYRHVLPNFHKLLSTGSWDNTHLLSAKAPHRKFLGGFPPIFLLISNKLIFLFILHSSPTPWVWPLLFSSNRPCLAPPLPAGLLPHNPFSTISINPSVLSTIPYFLSASSHQWLRHYKRRKCVAYECESARPSSNFL